MKNDYRSKRAFIEVLVILAILIVLMLIEQRLAQLGSILAVVYFFVERKIRKRESSKFSSLLKGLKKNWYWVILVGVILQCTYTMLFINFFPDMITHLKSRVSLLEAAFDIKILVTFLIAALGEEIVFRGLFQERFGWFMKPYIAILLTSVIFALMHLSEGTPLIVGLDLLTVFIDSIIFGVIYYRTKNVWVSWIAHAMANIVAFILILNFT